MTPARTFAYTVVLLVPDYACGDVPYGQNIYTAYVRARNERHALTLAQREACWAFEAEFEDGGLLDYLDFAPVLVFDGHPPIALYGWQL